MRSDKTSLPNHIRIVYSVELNLFFLASSLFLYIYAQGTNCVPDAYKVIYLFWHIACSLIAIKRYGFFSVYALFLMFLMFFIYDSLFFDLINYPKFEDFCHITFPTSMTFSVKTANLFLFYSSVFLFVLDITYNFFAQGKIVHSEIFETKSKTHSSIIYIASLSIIILLPVIIYRFLVVLIYTRNHGYIYVILNGIPDEVFPTWTNGISGICYSLFLILFIHIPRKKTMLKMMFVWGIIRLLKGSAGNRGQFLYSFFALTVSYMAFFKSKHIKLYKAVLIGASLMTFAIYVGQTRYGKDKKIDITLFNFLASQTGSRTVALTIIDGDIPYRRYPFIFSGENIQNKNSLSRLENIKRRNSINQLTSYKISPKVTLNGRGLGGSVLAEFIDCGGLFGVIFWTFILAFFIILADNIKFVPNFLRPFIYLIMVNLFHAPRGYFFHFLSSFQYYVFAIFLYFIIKFFCEYGLSRYGGQTYERIR